jgi:hypothetical protein
MLDEARLTEKVHNLLHLLFSLRNTEVYLGDRQWVLTTSFRPCYENAKA